MTARRGESNPLGIIVGTVIVLIALAILIFLLTKSSRGFIDSISCTDEPGTGLHEVARAQGCKDAGYDPYPMGFFTESGFICCEERNFEGQGDGDGFGGAGATATYTATDKTTGKTLVAGQTVQLYPSSATTGQVKEFTITGNANCAKDKNDNVVSECEFSAKETVMTRSGLDVTQQVLAEPGTSALPVSGKSAPIKEVVRIQQVPSLIDEPLTYSFTVLGKDNLPVSSYSLNIKMTTPVKYAGVTQQWSKRKEITAACENPVTCDKIFFQVTQSPSACVPDAAKFRAAKELKTNYCIVKDGTATTSCYESRNECTASIVSINDASYSGAYQAMMAAVRGGLIPENVAMQFSSSQGQTSTYSCIKSVDGPSDASVYFVNADPTTGRATFTLEHEAFENGYLCVYGHDKVGGDVVSDVGPVLPDVYYAGKGPVKLLLDVTPPTAILDFRPSSLQLRFSCTDNEGGSGCKEGFGVAYISQVSQFLRALVAADTPQNAAAWCPPYATSAGYILETRPITQYTTNEVRVLCLRVEDQAGNAGVAMATVYNAYDLAVQALALALAEADD